MMFIPSETGKEEEQGQAYRRQGNLHMDRGDNVSRSAFLTARLQ